MTLRIAIAGATGTVGRHVVAAAAHRGHDVVGLSRSTGVDVYTGAGLDAALTGVQVVIDVTNAATLSARKSRRFFVTSSTNLLSAGTRAGVAHHVSLSIVGIDDIDAGYYAGKLAQERCVAEAPVPSTIARTTQFHEFAAQQLAAARGPVAVVPRFLTRPVAAAEVADHLVSVAEGTPQGRVVDLVGPRDEVLVDMVRRLVRAQGGRREVVELPLPGTFGRGVASGSLRGARPYREGRVTFDEWLIRGGPAGGSGQSWS